MLVGIIGGGTIARLFIEHIRRGDLGDAEVVAIAGRSAQSRGKPPAAWKRSTSFWRFLACVAPVSLTQLLPKCSASICTGRS
jgi:predicted dinucleotide-utilizing enzyme